MSDEPPKKASDRFSSWKKKGMEKVADAGASSNVLKQALAINPKLKGDKSTREFLDEVAKQKAVKVEPVAEKKIEKVERRDRPKVGKSAVDTVKAAKAWMEIEEKRIANELTALHARLTELAELSRKNDEKARVEVESALKRIDPNRLSPMTQAVLTEEKTFLAQIGVR